MIRFACPNCRKVLTAPPDKVGVKASCPACKHVVRVPAVASSSAAPSAPPVGEAPCRPPAPAPHTPVAVARPASPPAPPVVTPVAPPPRTFPPRPNPVVRECITWEEFASAMRDEDDGGRLLDPTGPVLAEVRKRLDGYAASVPHHTATGFGKRASVASATEWCVYAVSVRAVLETRRLGHGEAPYSGWRLPATPTDAGGPDLWDFRYRPNPNLTGRSEHVITGTQVAHGCGPCEGRGDVPCGTCGGGRAVVCPNCRGGGTELCDRCAGTRFVEVRTGTVAKPVPCRNCYGGFINYGTEHQRPCCFCNGNGTVTEQSDDYGDVPCPCGTGQVQCSTCRGGKRVQCSACTGTGRAKCGQCRGCKKLVQFATVCRTFEPWSRSATAPGRGCDPEAVDALTERKLYQPLVRLVVVDPPPDVDFGPTGVATTIRSLLDAVRAETTDHRRVGSLVLEVGRATAVRVEYQSGGRHVAWLLGREWGVHAPTNPVTDALAEKLRQAAGHWPLKKKEAVALVREAVAMGERDGYCWAVLNARRSALPPDLWQAATNPGVLGAISEGLGKVFGKWFG